MTQQLSKYTFVLVLALVCWFVVFYQGILTAVDIWLISDIYNHCLFVLPCSAYLIYRKRQLLHLHDIKPTLLPLIPLAAFLFLHVFAVVGDINIFMHIATFSALPLIIWLCVGHHIAKILAFPLFFIVFAIPIGDELIPYLQELTTDISVPLLKLTNVPIYRNGLYLEIPEGRFLVAEACSGISFLISSVVFGFIYSYFSFASIKKRVIFIAVSVIVPILANALRVYGIVLTGHLSDMKHAVGADHLIYGGVFYTIVLILLIIIGEKFRDKDYSLTPKENTASDMNDADTSKLSLVSFRPIFILFGLIIMQQIWLYNISHIEKPTFSIPKSVISMGDTQSSVGYQNKAIVDWHPKFDANDIEITGAITTAVVSQNPIKDNQNVIIDSYIVYYSGAGGELIASSHRLFDTQQWSLINNKTRYLEGKPVTLSYVASVNGHHRYLLHWYEVNGKHFNSTRKAKLYQAYLSLFGKEASGVKVILTINSQELPQKAFVSYAGENLQVIRTHLYQALSAQ